MAEDPRLAAEALFYQPEENWQSLNKNRESDTEKKIARLRALRQFRTDAEQLAKRRGYDLYELLEHFRDELQSRPLW